MQRLWAALPLVAAASVAPAQAGGTGWSSYGGNPAGEQYHPATDITPDNVDQLEVAWIYRTGELPVPDFATPMTYRTAGGRQYVVIAAGGSLGFETGLDNAIVAFAPPPTATQEQ